MNNRQYYKYPCTTHTQLYHATRAIHTTSARGAGWPSCRASDSGARGRGFDTCLCHVLSLSKDIFTSREVLVIPRKRWLRPDMTENCLLGR